MVTYGTTVIPSDQITVLSGGTVSASVAFENTVGLVGGMDTANGSATPGDVVEVDSPADAQGLFGDGSELHRAVKKAFLNGAGTVWALPVAETTVTDEAIGTQTGTLANAPVFDPNVQSEHTIVCTDSGGGDLTVQLVYDSPPATPSTADTVNINPVTGEYAADAAPSGTDYLFDYSYGDYSTTAVTPLLDKSPRMVALLTENESVQNSLLTEVNSRATNFDFMHVVSGTSPKVDPATYSDNLDERRLSLVYPSRGFVDEAESVQARTAPAVAGYLASLALGVSSTNDTIAGYTALYNDLAGPSEAGTMRDAEVMPLLDKSKGVTIVIDMTTSTTAKFERVYVMQIVDEATEASHVISSAFVGGSNEPPAQRQLRRSHKNVYLEMEQSSPKLLDDSTVTVRESSTDENKSIVSIGLDIKDVMDIVDVTITVGDIVRANTQS